MVKSTLRTSFKAGVSRFVRLVRLMPSWSSQRNGPVRIRRTQTLVQSIPRDKLLSTTRQSPCSQDANRTDNIRWKKVTTNVSNFIMGTPIIDHYGDLIVSKWNSCCSVLELGLTKQQITELARRAPSLSSHGDGEEQTPSRSKALYMMPRVKGSGTLQVVCLYCIL